MANCNNCKKILWIAQRHYTLDGIVLCSDCYEDYLEDKRLTKLDQLSNRILSSCYKIIDHYIEKYGTKSDKTALNNLRKLLLKKYSIDVEFEELKDLIIIMNNKINEDKKLKKFENDLKYCKEKNFVCSVCKREISQKVFSYSIDVFDKALCRKHQDEIRATTYAKKLYNELKKKGIDCELEKNDGYKRVDIAIPSAKLYIEVDGKQHSTNPKQIESDFMRDEYSRKNGFVTKRYTNNEIKHHLNEIVDALCIIVKKRDTAFVEREFIPNKNEYDSISAQIDKL